MATTAAAPQSVRSRRWRNFRLGIFAFLGLVAAMVSFALVRPLTLLWYGAQLRLWFAGIHSDYTHIELPGVGRVRIHYYTGGSGDPVVLVHGLGGRAEDWTRLMPQLVHTHRVYALDLPGYGRSDWPRNAIYSIREETDAVEAFMDNRQLAHTDLGGWSMGGWIAMQVALDQPRRIRRLMIFDSAGTRFSLNWDPSIFEPDTPQKLHAMNQLLMPNGAPHIPGFIQHAIFRFVKKHGWVVRRNMDSLLSGKDLLDGKLGALKMPMLIVWGKEDHLIPVSVGEQIHRDVPQSELEIFNGCGHLAAAQCSAQIGPVVRGFLDEKSPIPGVRAEIGKRP